MLTLTTRAISMQTSAGQGVRVYVQIEGVMIPVVNVAVAAHRLNYSPDYIRQMCDTGKLIAVKLDGRWWIPERLTEKTPPTDSNSL